MSDKVAIVVGAGFGGFNAAKKLANREARLIVEKGMEVQGVGIRDWGLGISLGLSSTLSDP
jgi:ribulose 1,5-bisphosphate synthetase/thiazole synthase